MKREEAIHIVKTTKDWSELREALAVLVPELAESEDERIRKGLIHHLKELREWKVGTMSPIKVKEHYDVWISYLERQKEHVPEAFTTNMTILPRPNIPSCSDPVIAEVKELKSNDKYIKRNSKELSSLLTQYYDEGFWKGRKAERESQKPAWSEEDEKKIHFLSRLIEIQVKDDEYCFGEGFRMISKQEAIEMLKSLRSSWKPSEEQMRGLKYFLDYHRPQRNAGTTAWKEFDSVDSLYNVLLKLKSL